MGIVRADLTVSVDGCMAAPGQSADHPFGVGGLRLFETVDAEQNASPFATSPVGAFVMGRGMFWPGRDEWDLSWTGWWGPEPPYHAPVFVLTHHPRDSFELAGGTSFHFVTDGIEKALASAREAGGDLDVQIAGGASVVRQYVAAGLLDELVMHVVPITFGAGERPLDGVGALDLEQVEVQATPATTHLRYRLP